MPRRIRLEQVFRLQETRTVGNDRVVRYDNRLLQLERQSQRPPARTTVTVFEDPAEQLEIRYRDRVMRWTEVVAAVCAGATPTPPPVRSAVAPQAKRSPCANHPWRRVDEYRQRDRVLAAARRHVAQS